jgi:hypothetical protein
MSRTSEASLQRKSLFMQQFMQQMPLLVQLQAQGADIRQLVNTIGEAENIQDLYTISGLETIQGGNTVPLPLPMLAKQGGELATQPGFRSPVKAEPPPQLGGGAGPQTPQVPQLGGGQ